MPKDAIEKRLQTNKDSITRSLLEHAHAACNALQPVSRTRSCLIHAIKNAARARKAHTNGVFLPQ